MEVNRIKRHVGDTKQYLSHIIHGRRHLLTVLSQEREELDKLASDVQICKISGGVAGIVGSGLSIGGIIAAVPTLGLSLIVSAAGAAIAGSGAIVASGASIADSVISKKKQKLINNLFNEDATLIKRFERSCEDLKVSVDVFKLAQTVEVATKELITNAIRFARIADGAIDASRIAFGVLRGAVKGFAIAGAVFSIISLPIDIIMVYENSIAQHNGNKHKISEELKKFEDDIREELFSMEALMAELEDAERTLNSI